jgi:hypothetical protein
MLNAWLLSVRRRGNDPPDHFLTLLHLVFPDPDNLDAVLSHQTAYAPPPLAHVYMHERGVDAGSLAEPATRGTPAM